MKKNERGPFEDIKKFSKKNQKMRFLNSAGKCKRGALWNFLKTILLQIIETVERELFAVIETISEKVS